MVDLFRRELVYIVYYLSLQVQLIALYWGLGILIGSLVSVFVKNRIQQVFLRLQNKQLGVFGLVPAAFLGVLSPLCLFGTIPVAASFSNKGMRHDWLAAFMMSSVLLNPQLLIYSAVLGTQMLLFRLFFSIAGGLAAGALVGLLFQDTPFFSFEKFSRKAESRDRHTNILIRLCLNIGRNIRATGLYFALGILLTALYQRYVPDNMVAELFGSSNRGLCVLSAAALGVPLYVCGGGTVPLLAEWLLRGMSPGSAVAFMLSGPATKITNLSGMKMVLTPQRFGAYLVFAVLLAVLSGILVNLLVP